MSDDPRCCGTGTCIINAEGQCWCGQRWDGEKMCFMPEPAAQPDRNTKNDTAQQLPRTTQRD